MKNRPIQYFSKEYLDMCKLVTPDQIIEFIENFRELMRFQIEDLPPSNDHAPEAPGTPTV